MPSFATPAELEIYMGQTLDAPTFTRAQFMLDLATDRIRGYTGQTISRATSTVTVFPNRFSLFLPQRPVVSITSIKYGTTTITGWTLTPAGAVNHRHWPGPVVVTYTHGYTATPGDIKKVCLDMAMSGMRGLTTGVRSESKTTGPYTHHVTYADEAGIGTEDRQILDRYRIPAIT